ncbi:hypothetical protein [Sphingomonas sp. M1-B02]|uniref:hypothetical protein n=1 Tax=Sphingomonas sp. M1-B02 TaxID=3114300 RepID=UPI00223EDBB8|nr:hypothetical protein [Sphingomonas sp. S6-11]UZK66796.1 hypothetical protein OKW87_02860 [Sphingomonas sp. S6-11]
MMLAAAILPLAAMGAQDQLREPGLAIDCELRPLDPSNSSQATPKPGSKISKLYVWYGRLLAARKETRGSPIALIVDRENLLVERGQQYQAAGTWPKAFRLTSGPASARRVLHVFGEKPAAENPGRYQALFANSDVTRAPAKATYSVLLTGSCAVTPGVPYSVYWAKRTVP